MSEPSDAPDLDRLYESVRADVDRERGARAWLRSRSTGERAAAVLMVAAACVAAPILTVGGAATAGATEPGWLCSVGGFAALVVVATVLSLRPLCYGPAPSKAWLAALCVAALGSVIAAGDGTVGSAESPRCLALGAMVGAPVLLAGFLVDRAPRRNVALTAMTASLAGMTAAQILCPRRGLAHLVIDHFGALLLLAAAFFALRWALAFVADRSGPRGPAA